jgi:hypothetical protein
MTSASSASKLGLLTTLSAPARTCAISACGAPRQNRPDSSTLVSRTARMSPTLGPNRFYFAIDFFDRHRLDPRIGHALGDCQKRVSCLPAPDRIGEQPFQRLGCQEPRLARGARAVASDSSIWTLVMLPPTDCSDPAPLPGEIYNPSDG